MDDNRSPQVAVAVPWPDDFWMTKWSYEVSALYALLEADGLALADCPAVQARLDAIASQALE